MAFRRVKGVLPGWKNALLAVAAAILLILAFPDFEYWCTAWFAFVPLLWAIEREKESIAKSFALGWLFGIVFFFGTCWWLTYAPITYASFPPILAYFLLFCVTVVAGLFPALFAGTLSLLLRRFGDVAVLSAPFIWVSTEFLRYWISRRLRKQHYGLLSTVALSWLDFYSFVFARSYFFGYPIYEDILYSLSLSSSCCSFQI
jgi:apolipoprotein N-acyltransferase